MYELNEHHKIIVAFLKAVRDSTSKLSFFSPEIKEQKLLDTLITSGDKRIKQEGFTDILETSSGNIGRTVRKNVNECLSGFSKSYGIDPSIQLYFNTKRVKSPGGHFACCDLPENQSYSEKFIGLVRLESTLGLLP